MAEYAAPLPALPPLVPPLRFGMVEEGVYRGAYPSLINLRFLSRLGLRSMVSLLPEAPAPHLLSWCEEHGVRNYAERVAGFKEEVSLTHERIAELLQLLILPERQPVYVHCLDGVGVTGTLIMCLRKLQRWAPSPFVAEYARIARDSDDVPSAPPPHVLAVVNAFRPELELARLLPEKLPAWLEAVLGEAGIEGADGAGAPQQAQQTQQPAQSQQSQQPPQPPQLADGALSAAAAAAAAADPTMLGADERDPLQQQRRRRGKEAGLGERDLHDLPALPPSRAAAAVGGGAAGHGVVGGIVLMAPPRSSSSSSSKGGVSTGLDALALEGLTMGGRYRAMPALPPAQLASVTAAAMPPVSERHRSGPSTTGPMASSVLTGLPPPGGGGGGGGSGGGTGGGIAGAGGGCGQGSCSSSAGGSKK